METRDSDLCCQLWITIMASMGSVPVDDSNSYNYFRMAILESQTGCFHWFQNFLHGSITNPSHHYKSSDQMDFCQISWVWICASRSKGEFHFIFFVWYQQYPKKCSIVMLPGLPSSSLFAPSFHAMENRSDIWNLDLFVLLLCWVQIWSLFDQNWFKIEGRQMSGWTDYWQMTIMHKKKQAFHCIVM